MFPGLLKRNTNIQHSGEIECSWFLFADNSFRIIRDPILYTVINARILA